jgi:hypothetical protein
VATDEINREQRRRASELELRAVLLFAGSSVTMAIVCGAVIVSHWFAGVLVDNWERVFWGGTLVAGLMIVVFAAAAVPGGSNPGRTCTRITWLLRIGLGLFVLAPTLCVIGLVGDFYQL